MAEAVTFLADKLKIVGPKVDGSLSVTLDTGEYEQEKVAELLKLPTGTPLKVTIEIADDQG